MRTTTVENAQLIKELFELLGVYRGIFGQEWGYQRAVPLVMAEVIAFGRHTLTQHLINERKRHKAKQCTCN